MGVCYDLIFFQFSFRILFCVCVCVCVSVCVFQTTALVQQHQVSQSDHYY